MRTLLLGAILVGSGCGGSCLSAAADGYDSGRAGWGAWVGPVPLDIQAELDLVPGQGGMVYDVRPDGTADHLGLQPGHIVLDINGVKVSNRRDIRSVVRAAAPGESLEVTTLDQNGRVRALEGAFQERQPRRGPPPWAGTGRPPVWAGQVNRVAGQRAQLVAEQEALDRIAAQLDGARQALAPPIRSSAWHFSFFFTIGDAP